MNIEFTHRYPVGRRLWKGQLRDLICDGGIHHWIDLLGRCRCEEECGCEEVATDRAGGTEDCAGDCWELPRV